MSKKTKIRLAEDFSQAFGILYNNKPVINQRKSFKIVSIDYIVENIQDENISRYFNTIKNIIKQTIGDFKGSKLCKFELILTSEFTHTISKNIIKAYFNPQFKNIAKTQNFEIHY